MARRGRTAGSLAEFGYLTVTVYVSKKASYLPIAFNDTTNSATHDSLKLNLKKGTIRG